MWILQKQILPFAHRLHFSGIQKWIQHCPLSGKLVQTLNTRCDRPVHSGQLPSSERTENVWCFPRPNQQQVLAVGRWEERWWYDIKQCNNSFVLGRVYFNKKFIPFATGILDEGAPLLCRFTIVILTCGSAMHSSWTLFGPFIMPEILTLDAAKPVCDSLFNLRNLSRKTEMFSVSHDVATKVGSVFTYN